MMRTKNDAPIAYGVIDAARVIGLSRSTLYRMMQRKELRTVTIGRRRLIPAAALHKLMIPPKEDGSAPKRRG